MWLLIIYYTLSPISPGDIATIQFKTPQECYSALQSLKMDDMTYGGDPKLVIADCEKEN